MTEATFAEAVIGGAIAGLLMVLLTLTYGRSRS
jgi:hypothetical protein